VTHPVRFTIYARHSTDSQNPRSAQDQVDAILRDVANRHPAWLPTEPFYCDEAVSGTSTVGREAFLRMIDDAEEGRFDVVVVEDVSRFSRNRMDAVRYRDRLADHDVQVLAQADGYMDPDSETGVFMTAIKEAKAHADVLEIGKAHADVLEIGRRVRRGLAAQARKGFITGPPPFGYRRKPVFDESRIDADGRPERIGVRLKIDMNTAPVVLRIFELYRTGLGFGSVAARLNEEGVASSSTGGTWDQSAIRVIILNEAYLGHIVVRKVEKKRKANGRKRVRRVPESQQIRCENAHAAIISPELWDEVHTLLAERRKALAGKGLGSTRRGEYLLSGLVSCGSCSGSIVIETSGTKRYGKVHYYRCGIRRRRGAAVCDNRASVRLDRLDSIVVDLAREKVLTRPRVTKILDRAARRKINLPPWIARSRTSSPGSRKPTVISPDWFGVSSSWRLRRRRSRRASRGRAGSSVLKTSPAAG